MPELRAVLNNYYLDFINNYLTAEKFAEHNGLSEKQGILLLAMMREVFTSKNP